MEKGLKTLQTAGRSASRSRRQTFDVGAIDQMTDTRYQAPLESQGDDIFNDSGLGQDPEHHFLPNAQSDQRRHYATSIHTEPAPFSAGAITPPYSSNRSYSQCSSSNGISVINTSPYQTIQQPSPFQQQQQTLPSFSSAFGQPIVSSLPPATTQRRSPH